MIDISQTMTYDEREELKRFAEEGKCLQPALIMIAHWMRQSRPIPFRLYAANWVHACTAADREEWGDLSPMRKTWPLRGKPHMLAGGTEWDSQP